MQITPTQFLESINAINEVLISAHSLRHSFLDNMLSVFTLQLSRLILTSHYEKVIFFVLPVLMACSDAWSSKCGSCNCSFKS